MENTLRTAIRRTIQRTNNSAWCNGRMSPYFCWWPAATASVRSKKLAWYIPWICVIRRENLQRRHFGRGHWGVGKDGRTRNPRWKTQCKGGDNAPKWWKFDFPNCRWKNKTIWRRSGSENIHLNPGQPRPRRRTRKSSWRIRRVFFNFKIRLIAGWWWSKKWFLVHFRELHLPSSSWTQSQTLRAETRVIPNSTTKNWRGQDYKCDLGCGAWTPHWRLLEHRREARSIRCVDGFHTVHHIEWKTSRRVYMVWGAADKKANNIQARSPEHLHHRIPYLTQADTPKIQYQKEVGNTSGQLRRDPLHETTETENKNKNRESEEVQRDISHELPDWLQEFREILGWWKYFIRAFEKPKATEVKTLPRHLMNFQWSREQKWKWVRGRTFRRNPNCDICLKTKITRASCRRRAGTVVPRAGNFGDLITADHKILSEGSESRNNHRYAVVVQDLATQWIQSYPCKNKNFLRKRRRT